jgi:hypothetical protein
MASLETNIRGFDRLKAIWAMIIGARITIHFDDKALLDGITRAVEQLKNESQNHEQ